MPAETREPDLPGGAGGLAAERSTATANSPRTHSRSNHVGLGIRRRAPAELELTLRPGRVQRHDGGWPRPALQPVPVAPRVGREAVGAQPK